MRTVRLGLVGTFILMLVGAAGGAAAQEAPRATVAQLPVAGYSGEWTEHKHIYRSRAAFAMKNARRADAKTRFYQRLVGIHADELAWLANHRPAACYASEYRRWHRAVMNLRTIHRDTVRFLRAGNTAGVRRAARAERAGIKRLNRANATTSPCEPSSPRTAPPGNPFVGTWKTSVEQVAGDGAHATSRNSLTIRESGRFLQRTTRNFFCRDLGYGAVLLTIQGSGWVDTSDGARFHTAGKMYCHPRGRRRQLTGSPAQVRRYDEATDTLSERPGLWCLWRKGTGGPANCRAFFRGESVPH